MTSLTRTPHPEPSLIDRERARPTLLPLTALNIKEPHNSTGVASCPLQALPYKGRAVTSHLHHNADVLRQPFPLGPRKAQRFLEEALHVVGPHTIPGTACHQESIVGRPKYPLAAQGTTASHSWILTLNQQPDCQESPRE